MAAALGSVRAVLPDPPDYAAERSRMVQGLRAHGIKSERVLAAMGRVPRHKFVAEDSRARAYDDVQLPGRSSLPVARPYVLALAVQVLDLDADSNVLQVGSGCSYCAAVLCEITPDVHCVDFRPETLRSARSLLRELGYSSLSWKTGKACLGWAKNAPYDAILVTCAAQQMPDQLLTQLRDGGRMVVPLGLGIEQTLLTVRKLARPSKTHPRTSGPTTSVATLPIEVNAEPMKCQSDSP